MIDTIKKYQSIPLAVALVIAVFAGLQPDPTHSCDAEESQRYCFEISGGKHTRCYIGPDQNSWDYCSSGWQPITSWSNNITTVIIYGNGCLHKCHITNEELNSYTVCECDNGQYAYAGELI